MKYILVLLLLGGCSKYDPIPRARDEAFNLCHIFPGLKDAFVYVYSQQERHEGGIIGKLKFQCTNEPNGWSKPHDFKMEWIKQGENK